MIQQLNHNSQLIDPFLNLSGRISSSYRKIGMARIAFIAFNRIEDCLRPDKFDHFQMMPAIQSPVVSLRSPVLGKLVGENSFVASLCIRKGRVVGVGGGTTQQIIAEWTNKEQQRTGDREFWPRFFFRLFRWDYIHQLAQFSICC